MSARAKVAGKIGGRQVRDRNTENDNLRISALEEQMIDSSRVVACPFCGTGTATVRANESGISVSCSNTKCKYNDTQSGRRNLNRGKDYTLAEHVFFGTPLKEDEDIIMKPRPVFRDSGEKVGMRCPYANGAAVSFYVIEVTKVVDGRQIIERVYCENEDHVRLIVESVNAGSDKTPQGERES